MTLSGFELGKILDFLPLGLLLLDKEEKVLFANSIFLEGWGGENSELKGQAVHSIVSLPKSLLELSKLDGSFVSARIQDARGVSVPCQLGVLSLDNNSYMLYFEPESSNKRHRQQKLASLGTLAGGIAHDLNNVLTGVLGHISYLRLALPPEAEYSESILAIEDGARRAAGMVNTVLEFARGEESEHSKVNLNLVVAAGINLLRAALPKSISLATDETEDVFVQGDESQLSQLVMNFIVNARDALPDGGTILISLDTERHRDSFKLTRGKLTPGDWAKLSFKDNGIGIPLEVRDKIFDPFFTTKTDEGTGLGLATVWQIVEAHGGAIDLESSHDSGTTFSIYLPLFGESPAEPSPKKANTGDLQTGSERILVVDDEEAVRAVVQRSLELLGYEVEVANGGDEALSLFLKSSFDLVVLDMMMPGMSGDEVFFKLKELDPAVRVLIASGFSSDERTSSVLDSGGKGFIQKPFDVEELAAQVRRCLDM